MDLVYWINTKDYTTTQLVWNGIGCFFWCITYLVLVRNIIKTKFVEMPFVIAAGNIAWEFVWSFIYHPNTGQLYVLAYQACFFMDVFIFAMVFIYGDKQIDIPVVKKHFKLILLALLVLWLPLNYFFVYQGFDTKIGANSGYILNIIISMLYPIVYLRNNPKYFSPLVAWSKFIGTGCITVSMFYIYPENYLLHTMACSCFILDLGFAAYITKTHKTFNV